jgi:hypothetical protein
MISREKTRFIRVKGSWWGCGGCSGSKAIGISRFDKDRSLLVSFCLSLSFFFVVLGFEPRTYTLSHFTSPVFSR